VDDLQQKAHREYLQKVIHAFNKFEVEYKLVGGAAIGLINPRRKTVDCDF
jgi:hypothetical protein